MNLVTSSAFWKAFWQLTTKLYYKQPLFFGGRGKGIFKKYRSSERDVYFFFTGFMITSTFDLGQHVEIEVWLKIPCPPPFLLKTLWGSQKWLDFLGSKYLTWKLSVVLKYNALLFVRVCAAKMAGFGRVQMSLWKVNFIWNTPYPPFPYPYTSRE